MSVFLFPMWLLSGSLFPYDPQSWITTISRLNPLTYGVAGLRQYLQFGQSQPGMEHLPDLTLCWAITLGFAIVTLTLSWKIAATRSTGDLL